MEANKRAAVILAGGKGTRLRNIIGESRQKVLLEIGGKPLIQHTTDSLARGNIGRLIFALSHKAEDVRFWIKSQNFSQIVDMTIDTKPGVSHAIRSALERIAETTVVCCNGDELRYGLDAEKVLAYHESSNANCTMVAGYANHLYRHRLLAIREKDSLLLTSRLHPEEFRNTPEAIGLVNVGFLVFDIKAVDHFDERLDDGWDSIISSLCKKELISVYPEPSLRYFNVGTEEELREAICFLNGLTSKT